MVPVKERKLNQDDGDYVCGGVAATTRFVSLSLQLTSDEQAADKSTKKKWSVQPCSAYFLQQRCHFANKEDCEKMC